MGTSPNRDLGSEAGPSSTCEFAFTNLSLFNFIKIIMLITGTQYHPVLVDPKGVSLRFVTSKTHIHYFLLVHTSSFFIPHPQSLSKKESPEAIAFVTSGFAIIPNLVSSKYSATQSTVRSFVWIR